MGRRRNKNQKPKNTFSLNNLASISESLFNAVTLDTNKKSKRNKKQKVVLTTIEKLEIVNEILS